MTAVVSSADTPPGASEIFGTVPFALKRHKSPHGQVTAVSMMKDEGPFLIEWVAHHLAVGFTDLVVYTNDCSDGTDDMLIRLEELGLAHHRRNDIPEGQRPQPSALNYAEDEPVVCNSDWIMVFDADEFLSIRYGDGTLDDLISAAVAQEANGIVVTWRIFGSGGVVDWSRAPVTEQYLMAAPTDWNKGWGVKTLFKYDPEYWKLGIHRPKMKTKWIKTDFPDQVKWLNGSGRVMEEYFKFRGWRSIHRTVGYDWVQLNHYAVKSVESYAIRRLRGNVNNKADKYNADYWSLQDRNEQRDETMLRYTARRNEIIAALLEDPVLAKLHKAAVERVEGRLADLRGTEAYGELVAACAKASDVPITQIVAKPPQPRDRAKIAALMSEVEKARNAEDKERRKSEPRPTVEAIPLSNFNIGVTRPNPNFGGEWVANHVLKLPVDSAIFSPSILPLVSKGKFDRGLARNMPKVVAKGGRFLEVGAAVGFIGGNLGLRRPDLSVVMQEDDSGLREALRMIYAHNEVAFTERLNLSETKLGGDLAKDLAALVAREKPTALGLADPRLTPGVVIAALKAAQPKQVFLYGRLMDHHRRRAEEYLGGLAALGYQHAGVFDPKSVLYLSIGSIAPLPESEEETAPSE